MQSLQIKEIQTVHHGSGGVLGVPFQPPRMLYQISLERSMNLGIQDCYVCGEELGELGWYLAIKLRKRSLAFKWLVINNWFCSFILDDHVVHDHTCIHHIAHLRI